MLIIPLLFCHRLGFGCGFGFWGGGVVDVFGGLRGWCVAFSVDVVGVSSCECVDFGVWDCDEEAFAVLFVGCGAAFLHKLCVVDGACCGLGFRVGAYGLDFVDALR